MLNLLLWPAKQIPFPQDIGRKIGVFFVSFCCDRSLRSALTVGGYLGTRTFALGSPTEMLLQAVALDSCWALRTKGDIGIRNCRWSSEIQPPTSDNGCIFFTPTITCGSDLDSKYSSQSLIHIVTWILRGGRLSIPPTRHEPSGCNLERTIQTSPAGNREWARLHRTWESETSAYENRGPGEQYGACTKHPQWKSPTASYQPVATGKVTCFAYRRAYEIRDSFTRSEWKTQDLFCSVPELALIGNAKLRHIWRQNPFTWRDPKNSLTCWSQGGLLLSRPRSFRFLNGLIIYGVNRGKKEETSAAASREETIDASAMGYGVVWFCRRGARRSGV